MRSCYSVLALEIMFLAEGGTKTVTTEDVMSADQGTISAADRQIAEAISKMFDVTLSPVDPGTGMVDGFWKGELKSMERNVWVWVTRMKQVIRIG